MTIKIDPQENFIYYLNRLLKLVEKIEQLQNTNTDILNASLYEGMLPLRSQIATTANFALRAVCPLAGMEVISFTQNVSTFADLKQAIADTISYLETIPPTEFDRSPDEILRERAGFADVALPREKFLQEYVLPNFYFHLTIVYAIARSRGIPLSKGDFDGHHQYPEGFSFVAN